MCLPQSAGFGIRAADLDILGRRKRKEDAFSSLPAICIRDSHSCEHTGSPHQVYWLEVKAVDSKAINDISEALPSKHVN